MGGNQDLRNPPLESSNSEGKRELSYQDTVCDATLDVPIGSRDNLANWDLEDKLGEGDDEDVEKTCSVLRFSL